MPDYCLKPELDYIYVKNGDQKSWFQWTLTGYQKLTPTTYFHYILLFISGSGYAYGSALVMGGLAICITGGILQINKIYKILEQVLCISVSSIQYS